MDSKLIERIIEHEGIRKSVYKDSLGYDTIGIGFLCDARKNAGLSVDECMLILNSRIANLERQLIVNSWFTKQDLVRKGVLVELAYNLGVAGLKRFKKFLTAMDAREYDVAVDELIDSKWSTQIGKSRLNNILKRVRTGSY